jgi:hypothetical protein
VYEQGINGLLKKIFELSLAFSKGFLGLLTFGLHPI